ncbi:MAG: hypothetical protein H7235_10150 [Bdellovibrionaceae bacterium]|nr:hypothetical protein [Pseudobdellovibrionaceae bacterium]
MFPKLSVILIPILLSSTVFAAQVFQTLAPAAGQSEFTPSIGLAALSAETKGSPKVTMSAALVNLGISYYYGLAEGHSIGAEAGYNSQAVMSTAAGFADTTQKRNGLTNSAVMYKGLFETGSASIFAQLGYRFSLEKEKYNTTDREGNMADGQNAILVNVGAYAPVTTEITLGGLVKYVKANDGEKTSTTSGVDTTSKITGGGSTLVVVFFELPSNEYKPNASLGYQTQNSYESVSGGTTSKTDETHFLVITGSAQFPIQPNFSFNPEIIYQSILSNDSFDRYGVVGVSGSLRLLF